MDEEKEFSLNLKEKKVCVELARKSIKFSIDNECLLKLTKNELDFIPKKLFEKKACFVTLKINNQLRGCIGNLVPYDELYNQIIKNAYSAAFSDPRFSQLKKDELNDVDIEVSILTEPKKLFFQDAKDLLKKITKKDGIILSKGTQCATFLPSVWEEISKKEDFLSCLCQKAGLDANEWKKGTVSIQVYHSVCAN